tara:strand:- start:2378 stop:2599 length:222 start_codon:yes stop_codon:yes gene_type:complete
MDFILSTLLFFPDWNSGYGSDFLILHFFVGAILVPFFLIYKKAKSYDSANKDLLANGYKGLSNETFFGFEEKQ